MPAAVEADVVVEDEVLVMENVVLDNSPSLSVDKEFFSIVDFGFSFVSRVDDSEVFVDDVVLELDVLENLLPFLHISTSSLFFSSLKRSDVC